MFRKNANLAQALSVTAALAAVLAATPSAHAQVAAVSTDPLAVLVPPGTPPGTPPFPNFGVSTDAQQFHGLGATFPQLLYRNAFDYVGVAIPQQPLGSCQTDTLTPGLQATNPAGSPRLINAQYNYCGTGSGTGRNVFIGAAAIPAIATYTPSIVQPNVCVGPSCATAPVPYAQGSVSFAGTDVPLSAAEIATYTANKFPIRGAPIQVPTVFGGIAVAYNQNGGPTGNFNLATADLCNIFNGNFTNYNQLSVASTPATSGPITVEIRSDSSGTTNGFTSFLAKACGPGYFLNAGVNTFPLGTPAGTGPNYVNFIRSTSNTNVTNAIGSTPGGLGYIEASFTSLFQAPSTAIPNPPTAARLQVGGNTATFVLPNSAGVRAAATGLTLIPDATPGGYPATVFTVGGLVSSTPSVIPTAANSYPITVPTYILLYSRYSTSGTTGNGPANPNAAAALTGFFGNAFLFANEGSQPNDPIVKANGFSLPLPNVPNRATLRNAVGTITQVP
jgi:ABC-type phosphate transport system substrate-binding protein